VARTIVQTRALLLRSIRLANHTEITLYRHLRDIGRYWVEQKAQIAAKGLNIRDYAKQRLPRSYSWLEKHVKLHRNWPQFIDDLKWAHSISYPTNHRPTLDTAYDLMDERIRFDTLSRSRKQDFNALSTYSSPTNVVPIRSNTLAGLAKPLVPIQLTPTTQVLCGDATKMMRQHVATGSIDVAIVDPPYFLRTSDCESVIDYFLDKNGNKPRFREGWDKFPSIDAYEEFCSSWIDEAMRCLAPDGSMFIFGVFTNIGLINRLLQIKDIWINNHIAWIKRNSRPHLATRRLKPTHETIIWAAKTRGGYRYNYKRCKMTDYHNDYFSERGRQMGDTWDILTRPGNGHPSPKPVAVLERCLDVAGTPGGTLLEIFAGGGPGALAAMKWGMTSISIERKPEYVDLIREAVNKELAQDLSEAAD